MLRDFLLVGAILAGVAAPGVAGDLEVAARLSWSSAAQPVLHLLVQNHGNGPRELNVLLPHGQTCGGKRIAADPEYYHAFIDLTNWHAVSTNGIVQPGSWLHRSYPLALEAPLRPPCEVEYEVWDRTQSEAIVSGKMVIPAIAVRGSGADLDSPVVETDVLVEEDRDYQGRLVARVLVENKSAQDLVLYQTRRAIKCPNGTAGSWPVLDGVLQGEDAGPAFVKGGEWVTFVNVAELDDPSQRASCSASFEIGALDESGARKAVARASATLAPRGYLERPWRHRR